ncbi:MAG: hypothetical protein QOJ39_2014 [Candidatus Eremiobacteraeota bacterium]|jgi:hypothetical protein|nr:hypothetical protein [Candidatus Eremiobacteraeota bacterium]
MNNEEIRKAMIDRVHELAAERRLDGVTEIEPGRFTKGKANASIVIQNGALHVVRAQPLPRPFSAPTL